MPASAPIPNTCSSRVEQRTFSSRADLLARLATQALIEEAELTPKPGLVDRRGPGAHADMTLDTMHRSAHSLFPTFKLIAQIAERRNPTRQLREQLGAAGRNGEREMLVASGGCNTHRGAIWTLGLLVAAAAMRHPVENASMIGRCAAQLARFQDRHAPASSTNGSVVARIYRVAGARGEAKLGFPHIVQIGLPALLEARAKGTSEDRARLDALMAIMASLVDTCLLHRGGLHALEIAKKGALEVLRKGGTGTADGFGALMSLDASLFGFKASPGGSADLLAGTLFVDFLIRHFPWKQ
ncbi:MAG TPA: triphosphoribosyl-dephospho-CoA synthase [Candidatus Udaeobacter sp.]|nr:triphosphoribosyl-dephospho-CoA synthase [Candidatus Udaeobacter sp.]